MPTEFRGLQLLRGLAACMVVVFHATRAWSGHVMGNANLPPDLDPYCWANGAAGVDLFFVISGVVMAISAKPNPSDSHPARNFLERRLVRVVPLYWIMTAIALVKQWVAIHYPALENSTQHAQTPLTYVLASLLFIPYRNSLGLIYPFYFIGWTLSYEMFFYLTFALSLGLRITPVRLLTPMMLVLATIGAFRPNHWPAITTLASPLMLEFIAGVWLGWVMQRGYRLHTVWAFVSGLIGLTAIMIAPATQFAALQVLYWGLPAVLVVLSALMLEERWGTRAPRWGLLVGDASYSLYLFHPLVFVFGVKLMKWLGLFTMGRTSRLGELTTCVLLLAMSLVGALALYRWLEKPMNETLRRQLKLRTVQVATAA